MFCVLRIRSMASTRRIAEREVELPVEHRRRVDEARDERPVLEVVRLADHVEALLRHLAVGEDLRGDAAGAAR